MKKNMLKSSNGRILIESHRGCEAVAPENSWPGILAGRERGADLIEVDVQLSADGVAFLRHHYNFPDGRWGYAMPWSELQALRPNGEPMPRLEDVLDWARAEDAWLALDLKSSFTLEGRLHREVLRLLGRTGALDNVILLAWDHVELRRTKEACPEVLTRALVRCRPVDLAGLIRAARADAVSLSYDLLRPGDVENAHTAGAAVAFVELFNPAFAQAEELGVDLLSWRDPAEARAALGYA